MPRRKFLIGGNMDNLRNAIVAMKRGNSFLWHENKHPYLAAAQVGCKIKTRKTGNGTWRIWKVKSNAAPEPRGH